MEQTEWHQSFEQKKKKKYIWVREGFVGGDTASSSVSESTHLALFKSSHIEAVSALPGAGAHDGKVTCATRSGLFKLLTATLFVFSNQFFYCSEPR